MGKSRASKIYEFEDFRIDAEHLLVYRKGHEVSLAPKVVETLLALVERPGEVLSKDELMRIVWADLIVEENNLSQNLYQLRKVLNRTFAIGDKPLIETLKRRGYRFNGDVSCTDSGMATTFSSPTYTSQAFPLKTTEGRRQNDQSIAVLPFANMSGDADDEYFCDGLAEELLNALAKIDDLNVAARTSAFSFKNKNVGISEIGKSLNVKTVLEGSVRRSGKRLRITVQLINASDGYHLWSERYDTEMGDIFDVQDEITLAVVDALKLTLFGEKRAAVLRRGTSDAQAYELYLRGLFHFYKRTTEDISKAIELFGLAIGKDPDYALAYVGLADCYLLIVVYSGTPAKKTLPLAQVAATRAVEINGSSAEAHATLGHYYFRSLEWENAEREIKQAIELNPYYAAAHFWYSEYFRSLRRFDEALLEIERAQELDLLSPSIRTFVGAAHFNLGDPDTAFEEWMRVLEFAPNFLMAHLFVTDAFLKVGRGEEAIANAMKAVDLSGRGSLFLASLGYAYGLAGKRSKANAVIKELKEKHAAGEAVGFHFAQVYTGLKDNSRAMAWLERDLDEGNTTLLTNITTSYFYDHLCDDTRYQNLLRRLGIWAYENEQTITKIT
jgi:TolB-like protein/Flp pilus assembly protein TadD